MAATEQTASTIFSTMAPLDCLCRIYAWLGHLVLDRALKLWGLDQLR